MNEQSTAHTSFAVEQPTPEPFRRATFTFLFADGYERLRNVLEHPQSPEDAAAAFNELQDLYNRLHAESNARATHHVERSYQTQLLRDIQHDLISFAYRKEHQLPPVAEQAKLIRQAALRGQLDLAHEWLHVLWQQPDGRAVANEVDEELQIIADIFEYDFEPERSLLSAKISRNLDGIEYADLDQLPAFVEKQKKLLDLLDRVLPLAETQGWVFVWSALRNHVKRAIPAIHEYAAELVNDQIGETFEQYTQSRQLLEESLARLEETQATLDLAGDRLDSRNLLPIIQELQKNIATLEQDLEILALQLGGSNLETVEHLDEAAFEKLDQEIRSSVSPLIEQDHRFSKDIAQLEKDLKAKITRFFTRQDRAAVLREKRLPVQEKIAFLRKKLEALEARKQNQQLVKLFHSIKSMDLDSFDDLQAIA